MKITSVCPFKNIDEKKKKKKNRKTIAKRFALHANAISCGFSKCFTFIIVFNVEYQLKNRKFKLIIQRQFEGR